MNPRVRKLLPLGLIVVAVAVVAVNKPFGGDPVPLSLENVKESGFATGIHCGRGLKLEDVQRFKTPERIAAYLATKFGVRKEQRAAWEAEFVRGFDVGWEERVASATK